MPKSDDWPVVALRGKGVPVLLAQVNDKGEWILDAQGEPLVEQLWLRLSNNVIAELEVRYDGFKAEVAVTGEDGTVRREERTFRGIEAFQQAVEIMPNQVTRTVLSLSLGLPEDVVGNRILPNAAMYHGAVGAAWMLANGVDPETAGKVLLAAKASALTQASLAAREALALLPDDTETPATPGANGSGTGQGSDAALANSGS